MIIAIDGPAASGKGTLSKRIAAHYGFHHLDTGTLYRAVARDVAKRGLKLDDVWAAVVAARVLNAATLDDPALRGREAGEAASLVARIPEVRATLLKFQQDFAARQPGAVLDGRDIGTVICPHAEVKIFVTASLDERARRRHAELLSHGADVSLAAVTEQIRARDQRDTESKVGAMKQAEDAALLDTTHLDIDAAFRAAVDLISTRTGRLSHSGRSSF
jgi:CMP/dCMP kinase